MPHWFINNKFNETLGQDTENWLKDQFPYRDEIIKAQFKALYKINNRIENDNAFMLDNGWVFNKWGTVKYHSPETILKRLKDLKKSFDKLDKIKKEKKLDIVVILIPDRGWLYKDIWKPYYKPYNLESFYLAEINTLEKYSDIDIIYPYKELKDMGTDDPAFLKKDGHLSFKGAKLLLDIVEKELQKKYFPDQKIKYNLDSYSQAIVSELGFDQETIESSYKFKIEILNKEIQSKETVIIKDHTAVRKTEVINPMVHKNIYIYGVCYAQRTFYPLLKNLFKKTTVFSVYNELSLQSKKDLTMKFEKALKNIENDSVLLISIPLNYSNTFIDTLRDSLEGL